jgi:hypothetical protein
MHHVDADSTQVRRTRCRAEVGFAVMAETDMETWNLAAVRSEDDRLAERRMGQCHMPR